MLTLVLGNRFHLVGAAGADGHYHFDAHADSIADLARCAATTLRMRPDEVIDAIWADVKFDVRGLSHNLPTLTALCERQALAERLIG